MRPSLKSHEEAVETSAAVAIRPTLEQVKGFIKKPDFFLLPFGEHPRRHSSYLDRLLGYKIPRIEQKLLKQYRSCFKREDDSNRKKHFQGTETWIGLHPQVLQTPYSEIVVFLSFVKKHNPKKLVDLGAGYGRVGIVMNAVLPEANFLGLEILDVRLKEATRIFERLGLTNCQMQAQNILEESFVLPQADIYFIYDFSTPQDLKRILNLLLKKFFKERFFIVAKGDSVRTLIQLKFPQLWASHGVIHYGSWSLYSSFCKL